MPGFCVAVFRFRALRRGMASGSLGQESQFVPVEAATCVAGEATVDRDARWTLMAFLFWDGRETQGWSIDRLLKRRANSGGTAAGRFIGGETLMRVNELSNRSIRRLISARERY